MTHSGLTLIEVMTAILILTVGLFSLTAGSGWAIRSAYAAQHRVERIAALQATVEEVQALPFEELGSGSSSQGDFRVYWTVHDQKANSALVEFIAVGPLKERGEVGRAAMDFPVAADTLHYRSTRP